MSEEVIQTQEIAEAAIFYLKGLPLQGYQSRRWVFGKGDEAEKLRLDLVNKKLQVEPLDFMDAIRRMKYFSSGSEDEAWRQE